MNERETWGTVPGTLTDTQLAKEIDWQPVAFNIFLYVGVPVIAGLIAGFLAS